MTNFVHGVARTTKVSRVTVDPGLPPGVHRFRLVVIDAKGNSSAPDETLIEVRAAPRPLRDTAAAVGPAR